MGTVIYVGKAKNLRRRLAQYRNARRIKAHKKMRAIFKDAVTLEHRVCASELEALLEETRLIQELRPKWNVSGAFSFLYPLIGLQWASAEASFLFTHEPREAEGFQIHGAYRSRFIVAEAFFAWMRLLTYVGHKVPGRARGAGRKSYVFRFRRLPMTWSVKWEAFLRGESPEALELLVLALIENAGARRDGARVQEDLNALRRFYRHEAKILRAAIAKTGHAAYPVSQRDRDPLMLRFRYPETPACAP